MNIETRTEGDKLIITVDLTKNLGLSKSGKSVMVASSKGAIQTGGVKVNLNVYREKE